MTNQPPDRQPSKPDAAHDASTATEIVERDAWLDLFEAAPAQVKATLGLASTTVGAMALLACTAIPITELNRAMAVGAARPPSPQELDAALEWLDYKAAPGWALQIAPANNTGATKDVIRREGLEATGAGWVKFVQALPAASDWTPRTEATVSPLGIGQAETFGSTVQAGFGLPEACADWFAAIVGRPGWHCFLSTLNGEPAGAAAMFLSGNAAWCGMSATLPSHRGRGVQASLIAARLKQATEHGAVLATSETGNPPLEDEQGFSSFRNQKRGGFAAVYIRPNFKRPSKAT
ncbi:GNAT family N-acetyltransferase [Roseomonas sp. WA12]